MGLGRALSKAASKASKASNRGLSGKRNAQGDFVTRIDMTDPNVQLKQEAFSMEIEDLEALKAELSKQIERADERMVPVLEERLTIVTETLEDKYRVGAEYSPDENQYMY